MRQLFFTLIGPIAYLIVLVGSISLFSIYYRRWKASQSQPLDPWFTQNHQRDVYLTLMHLENSRCPPSLLKAALFNRAHEDIRRVYNLREAKQAANALLQRGSVNELTMQMLDAAQTELNSEILDVVAEAKGLGGEVWGSTIMGQANEAYQRELMVTMIERGRKYAWKREEKWTVGHRNEKEKEGKRQKEVLQELIGDNLQDTGSTGDEPIMEKMNGGEPFETRKEFKQR
jgi:translocation protein SEC66